MTLLIVYISIALGISFLCSIMEAVLLSVTPSFIAQTESRDPALGEGLRSLKDDIDRPLAAILSLNTIAHTIGAAGAGSEATRLYGEAWLGVISAVLTLLILVLSEIVPKTLGALYWRQLAPWVMRLLVPTMWLMWPLVAMSKGLTRLLARGHDKVVISREELTALAAVGVREGVLHDQESRILENLFRLGQLRARDIMTPRTVIFALPADQTVSQALEQHPKIRFSRIPVYGKNRDDITGFVLKSDLLEAAARKSPDAEIGTLKRPIRVVPDRLSLRELFDRLIADRDHLALVVDEYGGTAGLVTIEDLVETLLGLEIMDEADSVNDMQALARQKWRERAQRLGVVESDGAAARADEARTVTPSPAPPAEAASADAPPDAPRS